MGRKRTLQYVCFRPGADGRFRNVFQPTTTRNRTVKFNIYGRFQVDVRRENDSWVVYRPELGKRTRLNDVVVPPNLETQELATYLDDIFHEFAKFGENVEDLPD